MIGTGNEAVLQTTVGADGVIKVIGDIDIAGSPILESMLRACRQPVPTVLDLAGVAFVDSTGLRSLLDAGRRARDAGSTVVLRNVRPQVVRLLEITSTEAMFDIELATAACSPAGA